MSPRRVHLWAIALLAAGVLIPAAAGAKLQHCLNSELPILSGGVGREGIPALTNPALASAAAGDGFMAPTDMVLGVVINGTARAYPHRVLWWHEIINDVIDGVPLAVTYCPLTGSGLVYDPVIGGEHVTFGTSGLLLESNLIMFDRTTETLYAQMKVLAICGPDRGFVPSLIPVAQSTWAAWKALHPATTVVTLDTGHDRDYSKYPYGTYDQIDEPLLIFPVTVFDGRLPSKLLVHGIEHEGKAKAYPYNALASRGRRVAVNDEVNGRPVLVVFDADGEMVLSFDRRVQVRKKNGKLRTRTLSFDVVDPDVFPFQLEDVNTGTRWNLFGEPVQGSLVGQLVGDRLPRITNAHTAFWFAWAAFNIDTDIF